METPTNTTINTSWMGMPRKLLSQKLQAGLALVALTLLSPISSMDAYGQAVLGRGANGATGNGLVGEIEKMTIVDPADPYSAGTMTILGQEVIVPRNMLLDLPANRLTLQQLFDQAPADCKALGQSGLAEADTCLSKVTAGVTVLANRIPGVGVIMGDIMIHKGASDIFAGAALPQIISGVVTYINYNEGYFRINSGAGTTASPPTAATPGGMGIMIRLNDPDGVHTIQKGLGCLGGNTPTNPNCSADPRYTNDPLNYTHAFTTGYPLCIPSTSARGVVQSSNGSNASGVGDALCPQANRPASPTTPAADSHFLAPIKVGDWFTAEGNFETVNGVRFFSPHSSHIGVALLTRNAPDQPDYVFFEEAEIDVAGFLNQRTRMLLIGFTTLDSAVDVYSLHHGPDNAAHEVPLASTTGCDAVNGVASCTAQGIGTGANGIFKIRYDLDFLLGVASAGGSSGSPCAGLYASGLPSIINDPALAARCGPNDGTYTFEQDFAVMNPVTREIIGRSRHKVANPNNKTYDIQGRDTLPDGSPVQNGEYLTPIGMGHPEMAEVDLNRLALPFNFEGIVWNLDRRLGPAGCDGDCPALVDNARPALSPFPCSGLNPLNQVNVPDGGRRILLASVEDAQLIPPAICQAGNGFQDVAAVAGPPDTVAVTLALLRTVSLRFRVDGTVAANNAGQISNTVQLFNGALVNGACTGTPIGSVGVIANAFSLRTVLAATDIPPTVVCARTNLGGVSQLNVTSRP